MMDGRLSLAWGMAAGLVLAGPLLPLLAAPPVRGVGDGPVLVLTPPWGDALQVVADAGGRPVGPGQSWLGLLATPETADLTADFPAALRASGAWAVLNGRVVAALCGWTG
ncbi:hypothetical protein [Pseudooceanicola nitratireducens]|uniref:hypothetical protein n=1 Tax=Pseudooceanicola nitratireducens TaxID=517719 RepID=UPI0023F0666E|nr:hypothetical protein [Pseudooceanicola nitratireducens]